ncbi:MAG: hypothetical protein HZA54_17915 [Planctomycetes bacterium]|nr:hypothetical protein [Planctomycetota bacterium]
MEQLQSELAGKVKAFKMNAAENMDVAAQVGIMAVPTVLVFNKGREVQRWMGLTKKDVIKKKVESL